MCLCVHVCVCVCVCVCVRVCVNMSQYGVRILVFPAASSPSMSILMSFLPNNFASFFPMFPTPGNNGWDSNQNTQTRAQEPAWDKKRQTYFINKTTHNKYAHNGNVHAFNTSHCNLCVMRYHSACTITGTCVRVCTQTQTTENHQVRKPC